MRSAPMRCLSAAATSAVIAVLACAGPALAEKGAGGVYKCTDENGAVTYSTSRCKGTKREFLSKEKLEGKISIIEFPKPAAAEPVAAEPDTAGTSTAAPSTAGNSNAMPGSSVQSTPAGSPDPTADSAAAVTISPSAAPAVANPKIRTSPIERKLGKD